MQFSNFLKILSWSTCTCYKWTIIFLKLFLFQFRRERNTMAAEKTVILSSMPWSLSRQKWLNCGMEIFRSLWMSDQRNHGWLHFVEKMVGKFLFYFSIRLKKTCVVIEEKLFDFSKCLKEKLCFSSNWLYAILPKQIDLKM